MLRSKWADAGGMDLEILAQAAKVADPKRGGRLLDRLQNPKGSTSGSRARSRRARKSGVKNAKRHTVKRAERACCPRWRARWRPGGPPDPADAVDVADDPDKPWLSKAHELY